MNFLISFTDKDKKRKTFSLKDNDANIIQLFMINNQVLFEDKFWRLTGSYTQDEIQFIIYEQDTDIIDLTVFIANNTEIVPDTFIDKD